MEIKQETLQRVEENIKSSADLLTYVEAVKLHKQPRPEAKSILQTEGFYKFLGGVAGAVLAAFILIVGGLFDVLGKTHSAQKRALETLDAELEILTKHTERLTIISKTLYSCNFDYGDTKGREELRALFNDITQRYNDDLTDDGKPKNLGPDDNDYSLEAILRTDGEIIYRVFTSETRSGRGKDDRAATGNWNLNDEKLEISFGFEGKNLKTLHLSRSDALEFAQGKSESISANSETETEAFDFFSTRSCGQF